LYTNQLEQTEYLSSENGMKKIVKRILMHEVTNLTQTTEDSVSLKELKIVTPSSDIRFFEKRTSNQQPKTECKTANYQKKR
jgi:hypothetical protein